MDYLRDAIMEQRQARVTHANADLDCNRNAFFELLCRSNLDKHCAAFLIANVQIDAPEELLYANKKALLSRIRRYVEGSEVDNRPPIEWLRWAVKHEELLLEMQQDKDRITQILLAFDRHRDRNTKAPESLKPKKSWMLAVAGLLELLRENSRRTYQQDTAAMAIDAKGWSGASESTLTKLFAEANKVAEDVRKTARPKTEIDRADAIMSTKT